MARRPRSQGFARALAAALGLAAGLGAALAVAQPSAGVTLDAAVQRRLGVATAPLVSARRSAEIDAFAKVLDPAPLAQSESDLETAVAAAVASRAEAARAAQLHASGGSVSAKDAEAAVSQARQDALKVTSLRQQIALQWGPGVARLSAASRRRLVAGLVSGRIALVHVDTHNNEGQAGARRVKVDIGDDSVSGAVIGPARQAEPRLQSSGLIVEIVGREAMLLSVGLTQSAHIEQASSQTGVLAPRAAVIRLRGSDWVYVQSGPTRFQRRLLQDPVTEADGLFIASGLAAGERVVVAGALELLAAELARPGGGG